MADPTAHALASLPEVLTFRAGFNTAVVVAGTTLLGLAAGVIGVFALLRKRSLVADALSHATLPGIALAFLAASALGFSGRSLPVLLVGATITGILGVVCIQAILRHTRLREDAAIGIVLSVFFGAGVVLLSYIQTASPMGSAGLNHFIYGQAATMQVPDVLLIGAIALGAIVASVALHKEFALVCFNDAFAKVDGWPVSRIDLLMMGLVVAVTVAGLQAVGLLLVVAMLIIPPVAARFWTERLWLLLVLAGAFGAVSGYIGSVLSAVYPNRPAGAVIVLTSGVLFTISLLTAPARGVIATGIRHLRLRLRFAAEHVLEHAHDLGQTSLAPDQLDDLARRRGWPAWFRPLVLSALHRRGFASSSSTPGLALTPLGAERGARVSRNHALWEQYLTSYADVAPNHVDWSVDQVEHVLDDHLIRELEQQLRDNHDARAGANT